MLTPFDEEVPGLAPDTPDTLPCPERLHGCAGFIDFEDAGFTDFEDAGFTGIATADLTGLGTEVDLVAEPQGFGVGVGVAMGALRMIARESPFVAASDIESGHAHPSGQPRVRKLHHRDRDTPKKGPSRPTVLEFRDTEGLTQ